MPDMVYETTTGGVIVAVHTGQPTDAEGSAWLAYIADRKDRIAAMLAIGLDKESGGLWNRVGATGLLGQIVIARLCVPWGAADVAVAVPFAVGTHAINDATPQRITDAVFSATNLAPQATQITTADGDGDPVGGSAQRTPPFAAMLDSATSATTPACEALRAHFGDAWTVDATFAGAGAP